LSKIISIATAVPGYQHKQDDILSFMQLVYTANEADKRKLRFLYRQSAIDTRYSVVPDYSLSAPDWQFYPASEGLEPFPTLEKRMEWFQTHAPQLSIDAITECAAGKLAHKDITHLITVSCTGLSAPGLDLQIAEQMGLPANIIRTSVNFMGCYAAIHALKIANAFCLADENAKVMIVCTELCTLHFQKEATTNNIASSLLFADGAAAAIITADHHPLPGLHLDHFYAEVALKGKADMSWELSSSGFLMTLSGYVPDLIEEDFEGLVSKALAHAQLRKEEISHWCIHPGGRKIVDVIGKSLGLEQEDLRHSYKVLQGYGNMSSPTILFVLKDIFDSLLQQEETAPVSKSRIFGAAFGPGLTMETFIASLI
jgi:predicted naringenin-chalcone synthase